MVNVSTFHVFKPNWNEWWWIDRWLLAFPHQHRRGTKLQDECKKCWFTLKSLPRQKKKKKLCWTLQSSLDVKKSLPWWMSSKSLWIIYCSLTAFGAQTYKKRNASYSIKVISRHYRRNRPTAGTLGRVHKVLLIIWLQFESSLESHGVRGQANLIMIIGIHQLHMPLMERDCADQEHIFHFWKQTLRQTSWSPSQ